MIIIEYDMIQDTDNIMLRYKDDVAGAHWNRLQIDIQTFRLLLHRWGMIACVYPGAAHGMRPNLDNGTTNNFAPVVYGGAHINLPCGARYPSVAETIAFTRLSENDSK